MEEKSDAARAADALERIGIALERLVEQLSVVIREPRMGGEVEWDGALRVLQVGDPMFPIRDPLR